MKNGAPPPLRSSDSNHLTLSTGRMIRPDTKVSKVLEIGPSNPSAGAEFISLKRNFNEIVGSAQGRC